MKSKVLLVGLVLITVFAITACGKKNEDEVVKTNNDGVAFKEEYEALNGKTNSNDKVHRSVSIDEDNPIVYITAEELLDKMDSGETFYVYFGSKLCPWCRSVIEKALEVAKDKNISKIYYIDIWDNEGNEILRDKYTLNSDNELEQTVKGTDAYYEILSRMDDLLSDYTLTNSKGKTVSVGEKRIFAPSFVYVNGGITETLVSGMSSKQTDSRGDLTDEILAEETEIFENFFK